MFKLHAKNTNEHMRIPIGPKFDLSAEMTLAGTFTFTLDFDVNSS